MTVLGRVIKHNQSQETEKAKERTLWLAMDLVFRAPSTAQIAWALLGEEHRLVLELCQDIARDKTLAWLEDSFAQAVPLRMPGCLGALCLWSRKTGERWVGEPGSMSGWLICCGVT
ncbi:hypothetical protein [Streptomyces sp. LX-29]|uniref:hypothetical protein n=1 Tax=Streptomyces sp. LX-29 TaxID=2900152 RepID=UPI00321B497F